jgi:peptidoglycan/xylan/chitin deacetylase (PgdA/CDA1 family)
MINRNIPRTILEVALAAALVIVLAHSYRRTSEWQAQVIYFVPTKEKVAALTFDDGPHPTFTPEILATLDKYNVKATFFMIGKEMEKYPNIVKEVALRGHVIANHTYTHPHSLESESEAQIIRELDKCEEIIEKMTGRRAHLFRPPRGLVNGAVLTIAAEEGYRTVLWTVSADHHDAPTPELMAKRVFEHRRPGCIILAHDGTFKSRWKDARALPMIIEELRNDGYRFVTIPELLKLARKPRP